MLGARQMALLGKPDYDWHRCSGCARNDRCRTPKTGFGRRTICCNDQDAACDLQIVGATKGNA